jgi:secreted Zn-dependent insulinase-like peptidase
LEFLATANGVLFAHTVSNQRTFLHEVLTAAIAFGMALAR